MLATSRVTLGAPGVYRAPDVPLRALTGVRMDVCGFAGVAPRGPVRVPRFDALWRDDRPCVLAGWPRRRTTAVAVESFDEYRRLFGGFEGPGLLPYAVAAFFENGGRRAYVARIVHDYGTAADDEGVSEGKLSGVTPAVLLRARNEGTWGERLRTEISFSARAVDADQKEASRLVLRRDADVGVGTLLRLTLADGALHFRFVSAVEEGEDPAAPRSIKRALFDTALPAAPAHAEVVEASISIDDGDARRERFDRVGLHRDHPRWLAMVLCYESDLLWPDASWSEGQILPASVELTVQPPPRPQFSKGLDRYADIEHEDFFDDGWTPAEEEPGEGVQAFARLWDLSSLVVPDLYSPEPLSPYEDVVEIVSVAGPDFSRCVDLAPAAPEQQQPADELANLHLNPLTQLADISFWQTKLVEFAELARSFVVLLDVPPGLSQKRILDWRANFASSYAAAYCPWLSVARRDDSRDRLIHVPPSAVAAGIIARTEFAFGLPHGPANVFAAEVVSVDELVSPRRHDELHPLGINVFRTERDGVRLSAARTLSRDASYRQLSVRRLMLWLRRTLERQTQWLVFEPNGPALHAQVRQLLTMYLRRLFQAGAFQGAKEEESFFVRCDATLNPQRVLDAGQLIAEVGVAPAEPLEFILLRIARDGDGTLTVEE
jgi:hypothetical protein